MNKIKKIATGASVAAMVFAAAAVVTPAKAQVGAYDPISQWIVLSGLFNPSAFGGYGGSTGGAVGGAAYNPISQWIVLSGLFNPYGGIY